MLNSKFIDEISQKISKLVADTPAVDIEKNMRSLLQGAFSRLDLVTREEFDVQSQVLLRTREQLRQMEQQLAAIEARLSGRPPTGE